MTGKVAILFTTIVILLGVLLHTLASPKEAASVPNAKSFTVYPIGHVHKQSTETTIEIESRYQDALLGLEGFSHVWVLWWFDQNDNLEKRSVLRVHPRGNRKNPLTGVFAPRSPARP